MATTTRTLRVTVDKNGNYVLRAKGLMAQIVKTPNYDEVLARYETIRNNNPDTTYTLEKGKGFPKSEQG